MVKYREILRLKAMGISVRNIAHSCGCAINTVRSVCNKATAAGISWPIPDEMTDEVIRDAIFIPREPSSDKAKIDHEWIAREMLRPGVSMILLWGEYCESAVVDGREPYMYSAFCEHHRQWALTQDVSMRIEHKPGQEMQVDWVGDTMTSYGYLDSFGTHKVYVFVACLPFSGRIYAEGFWSMKEQDWIDAHIHAYNFYGGSTPLLIPDNVRTGVIKNTLDALVLNEQYRHMAEHYQTAVVPTRPRRPRDKAAVEGAVGIVERQAIAPLRDVNFSSLAELNEALAERVNQINTRPFQKRPGSRDEVFFAQEQPFLIPLPSTPYELVIRKHATVNFNYHVAFESCWYSVPYTYVKREVEICATKSAVWVLCDGQRIASHRRLYKRGSYSTDATHMPDAHRGYAQWNSKRFCKWAKEVGPACEATIKAMLASRQIEQQAYRSCRAVLGLAEKYSDVVLEQACAKALSMTPTPSYKTVKIAAAAIVSEQQNDPDAGAYLRGAEYYKNLEKEQNDD